MLWTKLLLFLFLLLYIKKIKTAHTLNIFLKIEQIQTKIKQNQNRVKSWSKSTFQQSTITNGQKTRLDQRANRRIHFKHAFLFKPALLSFSSFFPPLSHISCQKVSFLLSKTNIPPSSILFRLPQTSVPRFKAQVFRGS